MVNSCQYPVLIFTSFSISIPVVRSIYRESLLVFPTPSLSYLGVWDLWGFGDFCGDGIGDSLVICLGGGEVGGAWIGRGGEGEESGCAILVFGVVGGPGGDVVVLPIPFIKYFQYLSSKSRCAPTSMIYIDILP